jgi:hypothetical protein
MRKLMLDGKSHGDGRQEPGSKPGLSHRKQERGTCGSAAGHRRRQKSLAISMRPLGESHWRQYSDAEPAYLGGRAGSQVHEGVVHTERSLRRPHPPAAQVHRANSDNSRDGALEALDRDPLAFNLLIEQGRYLARYPPKGEIAVFPNLTDHIARLVQGTNHQPLAW